jgi:hypothetical protein
MRTKAGALRQNIIGESAKSEEPMKHSSQHQVNDDRRARKSTHLWEYTEKGRSDDEWAATYKRLDLPIKWPEMEERT